MQTQPKRRHILPILIAILLVAAVAVATVYAYLQDKTPAVENSFSAASDPETAISETFNDNVKSNVKVQVGETGYSVYVRAAIVVTWKDGENGNVLATQPVMGTDYTISLNGTDWFEKDGFYYCKSPVESNASTAVLINSCTPIDGKAPAGYYLNVEIIAQTIQAAGKTDTGDIPAVTDAWGVTVDANGKLTD